jgi:hypothetical protein
MRITAGGALVAVKRRTVNSSSKLKSSEYKDPLVLVYYSWFKLSNRNIALFHSVIQTDALLSSLAMATACEKLYSSLQNSSEIEVFCGLK